MHEHLRRLKSEVKAQPLGDIVNQHFARAGNGQNCALHEIEQFFKIPTASDLVCSGKQVVLCFNENRTGKA